MNPKDFLEQFPDGNRARASLARQIESIEGKIGTLSSTDFSKEYTTGTRDNSNSKDVKLLLLLEASRQKLKTLDADLGSLETQIYDCLNKMPDDHNKEALIGYYCYGQTQAEIGRKLGYDARQIRRFLDYAYKHFPMPDEPVILDL